MLGEVKYVDHYGGIRRKFTHPGIQYESCKSPQYESRKTPQYEFAEHEYMCHDMQNECMDNRQYYRWSSSSGGDGVGVCEKLPDGSEIYREMPYDDVIEFDGRKRKQTRKLKLRWEDY